MAVRAFVISIENYLASDSLANKLPGTDAAAARFVQWLQTKKNLPAEAIHVCAAADFPGRTAGTTRTEIVAELSRLFAAGRNQTEQLYILFSGHGFSYPVRRGGAIDVLVASDFVRPADSGGACIQLQEVQEKLWSALGPGDHYYFVDACRNKISEDQIEVLALGHVFPASDRGRPTRYTLYSTALGEVAAVNSRFPDALLSGLNGDGRSKEWRQAHLYVTFDQLSTYVREHVTEQDVEPVIQGPNPGFILEIQPVPEYTCNIFIDGANPDEQFILTIRDGISGMTRPESIVGPSAQVKVRPNDYFLQITSPSGVVQVDPPPTGPVDLFQDCNVRFLRGQAPQPDDGPAVNRALGAIDIEATREAIIDLENLDTGDKKHGLSRLSESVHAGPYRVHVTSDGATVHQETIQINPGQSVSRRLTHAAQSSPLAQTIARALRLDRNAHARALVDLLGSDPSLWGVPMLLSLLGAERSVAGADEYARLSSLALRSFDYLPQDGSGLRILSALEYNPGLPTFAVVPGIPKPPEWEQPSQVSPSIPAVLEYAIDQAPGTNLLWIKIPDRSSMTYVTHVLPNRVTLVVLTDDQSKQIRLHQYILPVKHLMKYMDKEVRMRWEHNSAQMLRYMYVAQQRFADKDAIEPSTEENKSGEWMDLINHKWIDPIMSVIAAYDIVRRGLSGPEGEKRREMLRVMVDNMRRFFPGIADIEAIEYLMGQSKQIPNSPPLLTDGVLAFDEDQEHRMLPLPPQKVDYSSPWTLWRGAAAR